MNVKWKISEEKTLALCVNEKIIHVPSAYQIFEHARNATPIQNFSILNTIDDIGISISSYPLILGIFLWLDPADVSINLDVRGMRGEISVSIETLSRISDHIIYDSVWYPFVQNSLQSLTSVFEKCGINDLGKISLQQYFDLKRQIDSSIFIIVDTAESEIVARDISLPFYKPVDVFKGNFYPYQLRGYQWLRWITNQELGCILADEMGLGKTIQVIAILADESIHVNPSLIVAPATLLENWRREILRFAPQLQIVVHRGSDRTGFPSDLTDFDVVITSYGTAVRDRYMLNQVKWNIIALDEAQAIKNPSAKRSIELKNLNRKTAIAITGTPMENKLTDLWSIVDFAVPGLLGSLQQFEGEFDDSESAASQLETKISPIILRRRVSEVAGDLPPRIDIPQALEMHQNEIQEYENIRLETIDEYGSNAQLVALIKLRQYCTHPWLLEIHTSRDPAKQSNKYERLTEILEEIVANSSKCLIFTSYQKMIDIFVKDIPSRYGIYTQYIDGRVPVDIRQKTVDEFSNVDGSAVLVLNPRAAGTGLNITAANHVIHYNLEWNPAVEDQATARSFRRGQNQPVTVHRLYYLDTLEEVINERLGRKRDLADAAVVGTKGDASDVQDLVKALNITPKK